MAPVRGSIACLAALLTVAAAFTEEESCGAAGLSSSCTRRTGSEVLLQRGHAHSPGRLIINGDDGDLGAPEADRDGDDRSGTEDEEDEAPRGGLSMLSAGRRQMMARMEAELVKVTQALAAQRASRNASNTELDTLIESFINNQQESQDRCPARLYEAKHQMNGLHEHMLDLAIEINSTETQLVLLRADLESTLQELEELEAWKDEELRKCREQKEQDTEMWHTLLCEMEELQAVANPAVTMDIHEGTVSVPGGSKYDFCEPTTITATTTRYEPTGTCSSEAVHINLRRSQVVTNNLGGFGPDYNKTQELRFRRVAEVDGKVIDMVITNTSAYMPVGGEGKSGKTYGSMGTINLLGGTNVHLNVSLEDEGGQPLVADEFHFSILDLDYSNNVKLKEIWYVEDIAGYAVHPNAEIGIKQEDDGRLSFTAEKYGTGCDNPTDPDDLKEITCTDTRGTELTIDQKKRSAMLIVKGRSTIHIELECVCKGTCTSGRHFVFSGDSALLSTCPPEESLLQLPRAAGASAGASTEASAEASGGEGVGGAATPDDALAVQPLLQETKAAALSYRACLSSGQPTVNVTSSEECQEQKVHLEEKYSEAYLNLTRLLSKYEHLANSTACMEAVMREYEARKAPLVQKASELSDRIDEMLDRLTKFLRPRLASATIAWEALKQHVAVLKDDCAALPATESGLQDVRDAIQALEHCPGLARGDFKVPKWVGSWYFTGSGQRTNAAMERDIALTCQSNLGSAYRAAYTEEIQAGTILDVPVRFEPRTPLPLVGLTSIHTVDVAKEGERVCWYQDALLSMEGQSIDCSPNGRKIVMCVRNGV